MSNDAIPLVTALANLGGLGVLSLALWILHREALKAFREELKAERDQYALHMGRLLEKIDLLKDGLQAAKCRLPDGSYGYNPGTFGRRPPESQQP